ncbi:MAG: asparagine synthase (glutamine-hydrolyzing) [Planctomycetes bacterium]|nr:asparagine synthase (glutamine-hydrolyzing) [Planctomycetota bacterium]
MCGICGAIGMPAQQGNDAAERMAEAMTHRGPDDEGLHRVDSVVFRMRRLSIQDIKGGKQPLYNEDSTIALVANGEIYNHRSLRATLEGLGHRFRTRSDCETIVHAYEQYGEGFLSHLRGMFAIAIHDIARGRVVLARDRLGEKPLYYAETKTGLLFASELRAMLASGSVPPTFDRGSLHAFFRYGFIPEPQTAIAGLQKLLAAHSLTIDLGTGRTQLRRYWSFQDAGHRRADAAIVGAAFNEITSFITDADVPVGIALSGGLDSGAIAISAASHTSKNLHAFTVGYDDDEGTDETNVAHQVARHAGLSFHPVSLKTADVVASYPETLWLKDDPIQDIAGPCYLALARAARAADVPVLLLGLGNDELFWGYPWVAEAARRSRALRDGWGQVLRTWWRYAASRAIQHPRFERRLARRIFAVGADCRNLAVDLLAVPHTLRFYDTLADYRRVDSAAGSFFTRTLLQDVDPLRQSHLTSRPDILAAPPEAAILQLICETYLRENGLTQSDRLTMAASVEARVPFVDYRLAELAYAHQVAMGSHIDDDKRLFRESVRSICPPWLTNRPKRGFTPPVMTWKQAIYRRYASLVEDGVLVTREIITPSAGRRVAAAATNCRNLPALYHDAVALELWSRQILAGRVFSQDEWPSRDAL